MTKRVAVLKEQAPEKRCLPTDTFLGCSGRLFVEQLLVYAVGLADSVMVASVGEAAVSAVSLVDSLMVLVITILIALSTGGAVVVGQYPGSEQGEKANRAADQLILFAVVLFFGHNRYVCVQEPLMHLIFGDIENDVIDLLQYILYYSGGIHPVHSHI